MGLIIPTGFILESERKYKRKKMSIAAIGGGSIGVHPGHNNNTIHASTEPPASQNNAPDDPIPNVEPDPNNVSNHHMSTKDFLVLKAQTQHDTYKILDDVIAEMKENMEEVEEAIETFSKMIEKTSKSSIALQILQKTFEAIDEMTGDKSNGNDGKSGRFSRIA